MLPTLFALWFIAAILPFLLRCALRETRQHAADHSADLNRIVREFARKRGRKNFIHFGGDF